MRHALPVPVDVSVLRLSRNEQIAVARQAALDACSDPRHVFGDWHHAGVIADDEAVCGTCGARLLIVYGPSTEQLLVGARVFGSAYGSHCRRGAFRRPA